MKHQIKNYVLGILSIFFLAFFTGCEKEIEPLEISSNATEQPSETISYQELPQDFKTQLESYLDKGEELYKKKPFPPQQDGPGPQPILNKDLVKNLNAQKITKMVLLPMYYLLENY